MNDDQTKSALRELSDWGPHRGPDPVMTAARAIYGHGPDYTGTLETSIAGRRGLQVALCVVVAIVAGFALIGAGILPGRAALGHAADVIFDRSESNLPDGYVTNELGEELVSDHLAHVDEWLAAYDQDELRHLDPSGGEGGDLTTRTALVETMEFRRACRSTDEAIGPAVAAQKVDRPAVVAQAMDPVVARLRERQMYRGAQIPDMFASLAEHMSDGDFTFVRLTLDHNCDDAITGRWRNVAD